MLTRFLSLAVSVWATLALGQETAPESTTPAEPAGPVPIAITDISSRGDSAEEELRRIRAELDAFTGIDELDQEVRDFLASIEDDSRRPEGEAGEVTQRQYEDVRTVWEGHRRTLEAWTKDIESRLGQLRANEKSLNELHAVWDTTRAVAAEGEYPDAAVERIGTVLTKTRENQQILLGILDALLSIQNRISGARGEIATILDEVEAGSALARRGAFSRTAEPLWTVIREEPEDLNPLVELGTAWDSHVRTAWAYLRSTPRPFLYQIILFVALSLILMELRRRAARRGDEEDQTLVLAAQVLTHPRAAAAVLTLFATRALHPTAPGAFADLLILFLPIPMIRMLGAVAPPWMGRWLLGLTAIFLIDRVGGILPANTEFARTLLLLEASILFVALLRFFRRGGPMDRDFTSPWARFAIGLGHLGPVFLAISLVANVLGYVILAEVIVHSGIIGAYLGILLYEGVAVIGGAVALVLRTGTAARINLVARHPELLSRRFTTILRLWAFLWWGRRFLEVSLLWDPLSSWVLELVESGFAIGSMHVSVGDLLAFLVTLVSAVLLSRFLRFVLDEDVLPRVPLPRGVPDTVSRITHYLIVGGGFFLALGAAGVPWDRFTILAGAFGVGIGFGMQTVVNNFVSGLILLFERPIQVGDTIEVGVLKGRVREIGIRASTIRTFDGAEVIVPNGNLVANEVVNWTLSDRNRRVEIPVGVAYGTDPASVQEILIRCAAEHAEVLKMPSPIALFRGFGESSLDFLLRFWAPSAIWQDVASDVHVALNEALASAGVTIPFPQRDLHLKPEEGNSGGAPRPPASPAPKKEGPPVTGEPSEDG